MEGLFDGLRELQVRLRAGGIESAAIGALALAIWGQPRLTQDIDLKVLVTREESDRLLQCLGDSYVPLLGRDPKSMLVGSGMLFVSDPHGNRADLLLCDVEFDRQAVNRGREVAYREGAVVRVCSPEDLVIYKLISTRARDHEDAQNVIRRQGAALDSAYIQGWLQTFEQALDDSTLIATFLGMLPGGR